MAVLDFDGGRGKYAIYTGSQDDAPLVSPKTNMPRVKWHADFDYVGITQTLTVNFDLYPPNWAEYPAQSKAIVAHGAAFKPMIMGYILIDGSKVPLHGSFIRGATMFSVYVDGTNIRIRYTVLRGSFAIGQGITAPATLVAHVCNVGISSTGAYVRPPYTQGVDVTSSRFRAGYFDTNDKHAIVDPLGDVLFYKGKSLDIDVGFEDVQPYYAMCGVVQNVNGYVQQALKCSPSADHFFPGTNTAFTPDVVRVSIL